MSLAADDSAATPLERHMSLTNVITLSALLVAVAFPQISAIMGILGSTSIALVSFIILPIFYLNWFLKLDASVWACTSL